jgi:hypothetical protein
VSKGKVWDDIRKSREGKRSELQPGQCEGDRTMDVDREIQYKIRNKGNQIEVNKEGIRIKTIQKYGSPVSWDEFYMLGSRIQSSQL